MAVNRLEKTVLCIEDDVTIREELVEFLRIKFKAVYEAGNGKEGLDSFIANKPDIVISDIRMPVMNGLEMSREIRKIRDKTPIIVTSAYQDTQFFLEAIDIGVNQFVLKPVNLEKLMLSVDKCLLES